MNQNSLFFRARWRLALWYSGVMGIILCLAGVGAYHMMVHAHWQGLQDEIEAVAGTLHDTLEPMLHQPDQMNPYVQNVLPNLCIITEPCANSPQNQSKRHILGVTQTNDYYIHFRDRSYQTIATVGNLPESEVNREAVWQILRDPQGRNYYQFSLLLKNSAGLPWGYMQIGRSMADYDRHLSESRLALLLGLPIGFVAIAIASWYLAKIAMQPVYTSYQQIQQFTADVAHELRTPLAAIQATVESSLAMDVLPETDSRNVLNVIERQNSRLSQLVGDLLLLSRLDIETNPPKFSHCCLNDILCDLVEELASLALASDISLNLDLKTETPIYIMGNESQLYRLFSNLIANAIQYSNLNGTVSISLTLQDRDAIAQIRDTGIGIAEQDLPHIFDRFYRVNSDRSRTTGGSGLGLAIAKAIANRHRGNIQVTSELGKGSKFIVSFKSV
ncbi:two-component sensor histidine kinase [Pseudanabaena sp. UWO311]|uniref:two-component system sensor histidine kinase RppB n=1 Tax=Pseudanabaena sp. UWO311 TaxID=2487337 RepID=UPI001156D79C|nr:two-component system sensor histidine kinase RppB [Pseudanabaena sp. UWO311]TYQ25313.1 two-component sensor histidine kinase [Pseudanabaena sp. UWO311]